MVCHMSLSRTLIRIVILFIIINVFIYFSWRLNTMHSLKEERYLELQSITCSCAMESVKFVLSADEMSKDVPDICTVYAVSNIIDM